MGKDINENFELCKKLIELYIKNNGKLENYHSFNYELNDNNELELIKEKYHDANCIVGTSTAGISHAAIIAHIMNLPMAYVRNKVKDHGRAKYVEGQIPSGAKVVVIEDLMPIGRIGKLERV